MIASPSGSVRRNRFQSRTFVNRCVQVDDRTIDLHGDDVFVELAGGLEQVAGCAPRRGHEFERVHDRIPHVPERGQAPRAARGGGQE